MSVGVSVEVLKYSLFTFYFLRLCWYIEPLFQGFKMSRWDGFILITQNSRSSKLHFFCFFDHFHKFDFFLRSRKFALRSKACFTDGKYISNYLGNCHETVKPQVYKKNGRNIIVSFFFCKSSRIFHPSHHQDDMTACHNVLTSKIYDSRIGRLIQKYVRCQSTHQYSLQLATTIYNILHKATSKESSDHYL